MPEPKVYPDPKVYFIGAGPGAADLITIRGAEILRRVPLVLYAGSLVSRDLLVHCRPDAEIIDTSQLTLDEQEAHYVRASAQRLEVARLHSGDPSIYGATAEQMRRLDRLGIEYEVVPGVSSFTAAAAVLKAELTKPHVSQTVILTRTAGRASPVPEREMLNLLAAHEATLCIFLSGAKLPEVVRELEGAYPPDTPVALVQKATWPQQRVYEGKLGTLLESVDEHEWRLSTLMIVGAVLSDDAGEESSLYSADYAHHFRQKKQRPPR